jgi:hypothetical protein
MIIVYGVDFSKPKCESKYSDFKYLKKFTLRNFCVAQDTKHFKLRFCTVMGYIISYL